MPRPPPWKTRNARQEWEALLAEAERRKPPDMPPTPAERRAHLEAIMAERRRTLDQRIQESKARQREYRAEGGRSGNSRQQWLRELKKREGTSQVVYLIYCEANGLTKIGTSKNVEKRYRSLCGASPVALELAWMTPGGYELEYALHQHFASCRRSGSEWFDLGPEPVAVVQAALTLLSPASTSSPS